MKPFRNADVIAVFDDYPQSIREKLMVLRQLIFDVASETEGVGELEETLKWGEPAYLTSQSKSGSTIRIDWKKKHSEQYAMYFHCQTNLVEIFRELYPRQFKFEGNRSIIFQVSDNQIPLKELSHCISMTLTYHLKKKQKLGKSFC